MDLIPTPARVATASANVVRTLLRGGPADLRPMPRTLLAEGRDYGVYRYHPDPEVGEAGDPVLLVSPLGASARVWDLRRGCSLVEHLVGLGRPVFVLEHTVEHTVGAAAAEERLRAVVVEAVPGAVRAVSRAVADRAVHVAGWSSGGVVAVLALAARPDLPVASLSLAATPVEPDRVPLQAPARLSRLTAPLAWLARLDDTDFLAQRQAVSRVRASSPQPARGCGRVLRDLVAAAGLGGGTAALCGLAVDLADVRGPVLVLAGRDDDVVPADGVLSLQRLLTGTQVEAHTVPGGHLGMLTGRHARLATWPVLDDFLGRHATVASRPRPPRVDTSVRTRRARPSAAAGWTGDPGVGANPARRFSSAASRTLAGGAASPRGRSHA